MQSQPDEQEQEHEVVCTMAQGQDKQRMTSGQRFTAFERIRSLADTLLGGKLRWSQAQIAAGLKLGTFERESSPNCFFRRFVEGGAAPARMVSENERTICFWDIYPAASVHLLVLPREPIANVLSLRPDDHDLELLEHLVEVGRDALRAENAPGPEESWRFGFHVPPMTSVGHLHLHCVAGKLTTLGYLKVASNYFVDAAAVIARLREMRDAKPVVSIPAAAEAVEEEKVVVAADEERETNK